LADGVEEERLRIGEHERLSFSVFVWTREGAPRGYGVIETLSLADSLMVLSVALRPNEMLRFLLVNHAHPPSVADRVGRVVWTRHAFNPDEELVAESRVQWVSASSADEPSWEKEDEEGPPGPAQTTPPAEADRSSMSTPRFHDSGAPAPGESARRR
jgi:hypothetical protein